MARSPDRCGRPPSELHERANRNLCSAKWKAKAESTYDLSSLRLKERQDTVPHFYARMAHFFALFLFFLGLETMHQFPVDIGDLLQVLFHLVIVLNPPADLLDLIARHSATGAMRLVQGHAQIPYRPVALATGTFAVRIAARQVALHQGAAKYFCQRRQDSGETLAPIAQGEIGEFGQFLSFSHIAARIIQANAKNANANLPNANFLLISL